LAGVGPISRGGIGRAGSVNTIGVVVATRFAIGSDAVEITGLVVGAVMMGARNVSISIPTVSV
jgi:hypothetical protein